MTSELPEMARIDLDACEKVEWRSGTYAPVPDFVRPNLRPRNTSLVTPRRVFQRKNLIWFIAYAAFILVGFIFFLPSIRNRTTRHSPNELQRNSTLDGRVLEIRLSTSAIGYEGIGGILSGMKGIFVIDGCCDNA